MFLLALLLLLGFAAIGAAVQWFNPNSSLLDVGTEQDFEEFLPPIIPITSDVEEDSIVPEASEMQVSDDSVKVVTDRYAARVLMLIQHDYVDAKAYNGWDGALGGVKTDIKNLYNHFLSRGEKWFSPNGKGAFDKVGDAILKNEMATKEVFIANATVIKANFANMPGKKLLFVGESGHGGQDWTEKDNDSDHFAETRVMYNGQLRDDEVRELYAKTLGSDWEIVWWIDRCHAGGMDKGLGANLDTGKGTPKTMPAEHIAASGHNITDLKNIIKAIPTQGEAQMKFLAACQEAESAMDLGAAKGGKFTYEALVQLNKDNLLSYATLIAKARDNCKGYQTPKLAKALGQKQLKWKDTNTFLN